jgi:hypothetical protein
VAIPSEVLPERHPAHQIRGSSTAYSVAREWAGH